MVSRNTISLLLIVLTICAVQAQISSDSLRRLITTLEYGPEKLTRIIDLADFVNWENIEEAKTISLEAIHMAKDLGDIQQLGYAYIEYAESIVAEYPDSFFIYYEKVKELWESINYKKGEAIILVEEGLSSENAGLLEKSMQSHIQALKIFEDLGFEEDVHNTEVNIAALLSSIGKNEDALSYMEKAKAYIFASPVVDAQAYFYLILGDIYVNQNRNDEAIATFKKLQGIALKEKYYNDVVTSSTRLSKLYTIEGTLDKAKMNLDTALKYAYIFGDGFFIARAHKGFGDFYLATKDYRSAVQSYEKLESARRDPFVRFTLSEGYLSNGKAYAGLGEYKNAYENLMKYSLIQDSIFNTKSVQIAQDTEAKYESEKKELQLERQRKERNILLFILSLVFATVLGLIVSYRKIKSTNSLLKQTNTEKEYLIKEIHHRVKNNLQVLSSLLNLQADYIEDPSALNAVSEGKNRVQSMALLHQKLYTGSNLAAVRMDDYIREFTSYLMDSFDIEERIKIQQSVSVETLDIDTAVPLGLIINELVTNALKYGFPDLRRGHIVIKLWVNSEQKLCLQVADNGVGKQATPLENSTSFGQDLIKILSKKLKGDINVQCNDGYKTIIKFRRYKLT